MKRSIEHYKVKKKSKVKSKGHYKVFKDTSKKLCMKKNI